MSLHDRWQDGKRLRKAFYGATRREAADRLTAATLLLAKGVDARTIMETLGHSQISLTRNTYIHVLPALQKAAAERMNAVLCGTVITK